MKERNHTTSKQLLAEIGGHIPGEPGFTLLFTQLAKRALAYDDLEDTLVASTPRELMVECYACESPIPSLAITKDLTFQCSNCGLSYKGWKALFRSLRKRKSRHFTNEAVEAGKFPKHGGLTNET